METQETTPAKKPRTRKPAAAVKKPRVRKTVAATAETVPVPVAPTEAPAGLSHALYASVIGLLLGTVLFLGIGHMKGKAVEPSSDNPVPVVVKNPAAAMPGVLAALQAENYTKAAARLQAGDDIVTVNTELQSLNKSAIDAAYLPLDTYLENTLEDADAATTANVYKTTAKEFGRAVNKK